MTLRDAGEQMLLGAVMMLPATALACLPFMLIGAVIDDMSGVVLMFCACETIGVLMGLLMLD
jgi:hypothetical protein